jgi:hypothetical protein
LITKVLSKVEPKEEFSLEDIIKRIILSVMYSVSLKLESPKFEIILRILAVSVTLLPNHITNAHLGLNTKLFDNILFTIFLALFKESSFSLDVKSFILTRLDKIQASSIEFSYLEKSKSLYIL